MHLSWVNFPRWTSSPVGFQVEGIPESMCSDLRASVFPPPVVERGGALVHDLGGGEKFSSRQ